MEILFINMENMYKILFICYGNICRSPMAEFVMKKLVCDDVLLNGKVYVESAATSTEEIGNGIYGEAKKVMLKNDIPFSNEKVARQVTKDDYEKFDLLVVMDDENLRGLKRIIVDDTENKVHKLLEFIGSNNDIEDPWYTRNFEGVLKEIEMGCNGLKEKIYKKSTEM